ncbi:hypothetical protein HYALB_00000236 [Hymenoscyphus albidus]|uniref:feruloyl esterase n=1 Tax=Hymenoscyphus albidus TaxID=595503 RepID=A0A9N9LU13_9HELO|nr:hypothetical protein HYALB_00000236 [Hymenoscyphus albidus]
MSSSLSTFVALASILFSGHAYAASSAGCGKNLPAHITAGGQSHEVNFTTVSGGSPGMKRQYWIHVPSNYNKDKPAPLIFSFHGNGGTAANQEDLSQFSNESWNPNAIAVYPLGVGKSAGQHSWEGAPYSVPGVDDVSFVEDMINSFNADYCIDTSRIYAAGKSNGGGFTGTLACSRLSAKIAAFAPVAGAFYVPGSTDDDCAPTTIPLPCPPARNPIPIIEFHGLADTTIAYAGGPRSGQCLPSIPHWIREWSKREGFGLTNRTTSLFGGNVLKYEYAEAAGILGEITHYRISGLGHDWPSVGPNPDSSTGTYLDATPLIMDFFNSYPLPN